MEAVAMSVINNMLKNIEQREAKQVTQQHAVGVNVTPVYDLQNLIFKALVIATVVSIVIAAYLLLPAAASNKPAQDELSVTLTSDLPQEEVKAGLTTKKSVANTIITDEVVESSNVQPEVATALNTQPGVKVANIVGKVAPQNIDEAEQLLVNKLINDAAAVNNSQPQALGESKDITAANKNLPAVAAVVSNLPHVERSLEPNLKTSKAKPANVMIKSSSKTKSQQVLITEQLLAAKQAIQFGLYSEAISDLNNILAQSKQHIEARNLLAATYFKQQDISSAQQVLQAGISQNPDVLQWRIMLSKILIMQQQYDDVLKLLSDDFETQANFEFWVLQGTAAQSANQHNKALNSFKQLTKLQPSQAKWWLALATSKDALGEYPDAKHLYKVALDLGGLNTAMTQHALQRLVALKEAV